MIYRDYHSVYHSVCTSVNWNKSHKAAWRSHVWCKLIVAHEASRLILNPTQPCDIRGPITLLFPIHNPARNLCQFVLDSSFNVSLIPECTYPLRCSPGCDRTMHSHKTNASLCWSCSLMWVWYLDVHIPRGVYQVVIELCAITRLCVM
jgi:hypothetical protein